MKNFNSASGVSLGVSGSISFSGCCDDDLDVCHCDCHKPKVKGQINEHNGPCCEQSLCGKRIKIGMLEMHVALCRTCMELLNAPKQAFVPPVPPKPWPED
jgi:hypothetical protein